MSNVDRHVRVNPQQFAALARFVGVGGERLPVLLLRNVGGALEQGVERPVGHDQIASALLADAGHALDVVDVSPINASTSTT